ncbi:MAG TPA: glycine zipper family protein [Alphaproteobacteria bacterium]|nr:glycine zipper family protein [Alphaproteobacteria bacterium]
MTLRSSLAHLPATAALALALAACGTTSADRAVSGGALGAAAGAAIGAMTGSAATGALIGGAAGIAAGALTDPCKVNLGNPYWRDKNATREDYYRRCGHYPPR